MKRKLIKIISTIIIMMVLPTFLLNSCKDFDDDDEVLGSNEVFIQRIVQ